MHVSPSESHHLNLTIWVSPSDYHHLSESHHPCFTIWISPSKSHHLSITIWVSPSDYHHLSESHHPCFTIWISPSKYHHLSITIWVSPSEYYHLSESHHPYSVLPIWSYALSFIDIDECAENVCHTSAACENSIGSFQCTCTVGFNGDGTNCIGKSSNFNLITYFSPFLKICTQ